MANPPAMSASVTSDWTVVPHQNQDEVGIISLHQSTLEKNLDPDYVPHQPIESDRISDASKSVSELSTDSETRKPRTPEEIAQAMTQSTNPEHAPDAPQPPCNWLKTAAIASLIIFGILTAICALCATGIYPPEMLGGSVGLTYCFGVGLSGVAIGAALFFLEMQSEKEELPVDKKV